MGRVIGLSADLHRPTYTKPAYVTPLHCTEKTIRPSSSGRRRRLCRTDGRHHVAGGDGVDDVAPPAARKTDFAIPFAYRMCPPLARRLAAMTNRSVLTVTELDFAYPHRGKAKSSSVAVSSERFICTIQRTLEVNRRPRHPRQVPEFGPCVWCVVHYASRFKSIRV